MKRWTSALLALLLAANLAACDTVEPPAETEIPETTAAPETTEQAVTLPTAKPQSVSTDSTGYDAVLSDYKTALEEGWSREEYEAAGLNTLPSLGGTPENVGYLLIDQNGSGTNELLIGAMDQSYIYAMYTLKDDEPVCVINSGERDTFQLLTGSKYYNVRTSDAEHAVFAMYAFYGGEMVFHDALVYDGTSEQGTPWFKTTDETLNPDNLMAYSPEDAEKYVTNAESNIQMLNFTPFTEYTP